MIGSDGAVILPANGEAERSILGAVLLDDSAYTQATALKPEDFSSDAHRRIFACMRRLHDSRRPIDLITLTEELARGREIEAVGGVAYISSLTDGLPHHANIEHYVSIARDKGTLRGVIRAANDAIARAQDQTESAAEVLGSLEADLKQLSENRAGLRVVNCDEFLKMGLPPREMLLNPVLPVQGLTMLYGFRGFGKTYITLRAAVAVAGGGRFARWIAPKPAGVVYVDGEMPAALLQSRLAGIAAGADEFDPEMLRLITPDLQSGPMPDLATRAGQMRIEDELGTARLLILDNISTLFRQGVENESESWIPAQDWSLRLRQRGVSVLFVHHAGKNGSQRGASKREDVLDCVISLKRPSDYSPEEGLRCEIHFEKNRGFYGPEAMPFELQMSQAANGSLTWTVRELAEAKRAQAVALKSEGLSLSRIAETMNISKTTAHRLVSAE